MINACDNTKKRIARQFSHAAERYDEAARVQVDIAFDAVNRLPSHSSNLLDLGCGTGRVTRQISDKCDRLWAIDIAEGMLRFASAEDANGIQWLVADAEKLPFQSACFDTVFSSMALQWCQEPAKVLSETHRVLTQCGSAMLAIMCNGSLHELSRSWREIDVLPHTNDFPSSEELTRLAVETGFDVKVEERQYTTWHTNVRALLGSIKDIGANVVTKTRHRSKIRKSTLEELQCAYARAFGENEQLPLTYNVCFLTLRKI